MMKRSKDDYAVRMKKGAELNVSRSYRSAVLAASNQLQVIIYRGLFNFSHNAEADRYVT